MITSQEHPMGRFSVTVELSNNIDLVRAEAGDIPASEIRRLELRGVVDTGAARLVLPATVVERLGLKTAGNVTVRFANGRCAERAMATGVHLTYANRTGVFSAVVEPGRDSALIGAIVLEDLDLIADCTTQSLAPRDPQRIISEVE